ncbi:hypothetical protein PoB_002396100 [Plakobranchus ocellatus]|uniref:Uncharacterized protein n=1 Tax=Plakobranchus ocellatus TaxID=259542 RepID=A0AAV3ZNE9_9GAST|nr:hypothetical protein PoB_002396100 [Plakobranchus ocellatus]
MEVLGDVGSDHLPALINIPPSRSVRQRKAETTSPDENSASQTQDQALSIRMKRMTFLPGRYYRRLKRRVSMKCFVSIYVHGLENLHQAVAEGKRARREYVRSLIGKGKLRFAIG